MSNPCATNPELWFGYPDEDSGNGAAKARAYERSATKARIQYLRRCPLAQQRLCAERAVKHREEYGVWAGVKLPGASTASVDSWLRLMTSCAESRRGRSMPDSSRKTPPCWRATNAMPSP